MNSFKNVSLYLNDINFKHFSPFYSSHKNVHITLTMIKKNQFFFINISYNLMTKITQKLLGMPLHDSM